ncbi:MAG: DNA/RNA nuclease SfsA [Alphaproteobacteria bacterium]|nr:DNA/RNA nuclease SfsA [Alphaproteobacteria bacterium]MBX9976809.1 DNA/RNA nuclease SfsA [Alphaproteobacteria bacterium]
MHFLSPLIPGRLIKRYNRFLADIQLDSGEKIIAHCPNSGAMMGVKTPGSPVLVTRHPDDGKRKLLYTLEFVFADGVFVGVNTFRPNALVEEAIQQETIAELKGYESLTREVRYGQNSRIDILLKGEDLPNCYVEVKNAQLKRDVCVEFPDSVTARGTKHLLELMQMVKDGHRAVVIYVAQRMDVSQFCLASDIDPTYAKTAEAASKAGVEFLCYGCELDADKIIINRQITILEANK